MDIDAGYDRDSNLKDPPYKLFSINTQNQSSIKRTHWITLLTDSTVGFAATENRFAYKDDHIELYYNNKNLTQLLELILQ